MNTILEETRALNTIHTTKTVSFPAHMLKLVGIKEKDKRVRVLVVEEDNEKTLLIKPVND